MVACTTDSAGGRRDRAVLLTALLAALRRSEVARLDLADLGPRPEGAVLCIRRSKGDQAAAGRQVYVSLTRNPRTCATRVLQALLGDRGEVEGPLFLSLRKGMVKPGQRMPAVVVNAVVQW